MNRQVYFAKCGDRIKIGLATNVRARLSNLRVGAAAPIELLAAVAGDHHLERALHKKLQPHRIAGEWFRDCDEVRIAIDNSVNNFDVGIDRRQKTGSPQFGAVCRLLWPKKTSAVLAAIGGKDDRTAKRWLAGEHEPPVAVILAVINKMFERN